MASAQLVFAMIPGFYQSASGMIAQMDNYRVIAENLAASTVNGYRKNNASFESYMNPSPPQTGNTDTTSMLGDRLYPTQHPVTRTVTDFSNGTVEQDYNPLHVALKGKGFFAIEIPDKQGTVYTRDGAFSINAQNELVASNGWRVLGDDGSAIVLPKPNLPVMIHETGDVAQAGQNIGKIKIANFKEPEKELAWVGGNHFKPVNPEAKPETNDPSTYNLMQGYVEKSNVNVLQEMVSLVQATRLYEANQKILQAQDSSMDTVIRQVSSRV
ncbi:MAG: flagellar hook-basal body protein [Verrucomicrobiae bacterium]|nr:flagellar hook-basal body protein [Verrucomicrobiae bacterium]